ncbi:MAG: hypothetical protein D6692_10490 [Planctomycetota bacterium]|nr:MAG: hypothetical protein D6692_10490 [Planctomycetota bacterium]
MSRYERTGALDSPERSAVIVDLASGGVDERRVTAQSEPGLYARLVNGEIRTGYPTTRRGMRPAPWASRAESGVRVPLGSVFRAAHWHRPLDPRTGEQQPGFLLLAMDDALWLCRPNNEPRLVRSSVFDATERVEMFAANERVYILRGLKRAPLVYDPLGLAPFPSAGLHELPPPSVGQALPPARTGAFQSNRIIQRYGLNELIFSDLFAWSYASDAQIFTAESRGGGEIVRVWPYARNSLLVFKTDAVVQFVGVHDLSTMRAERVYAASGCVAPDSVAQSGDRVFYLSARGVEVLTVDSDGLVRASGPEFSAPMARQIDAIDWDRAATARGLVVDGYYLLWVPSTATLSDVDTVGEMFPGVMPVPQDLDVAYDLSQYAFSIPLTFPFVFNN